MTAATTEPKLTGPDGTEAPLSAWLLARVSPRQEVWQDARETIYAHGAELLPVLLDRLEAVTPDSPQAEVRGIAHAIADTNVLGQDALDAWKRAEPVLRRLRGGWAFERLHRNGQVGSALTDAHHRLKTNASRTLARGV